MKTDKVEMQEKTNEQKIIYPVFPGSEMNRVYNTK